MNTRRSSIASLSGDEAPLALESHTGRPVTSLSGAWIDEEGALLIETEHGVGVIHDRDLDKMLPH